MKIVLLFFLLVITASRLLSQEVVTISVVSTGEQSGQLSDESIVLEPGDHAEILTAAQGGRFNWGAVSLTISGIESNLGYRFNDSDVLDEGIDSWTIGGPATIRVRSPSRLLPNSGPIPNFPDEVSFLTARVTRAADQTNHLPANTIVLPSSSDQDFEVYLEGSSDLTNWVRVDAGTFGPNSPLRFFRVRGRQASSD